MSLDANLKFKQTQRLLSPADMKTKSRASVPYICHHEILDVGVRGFAPGSRSTRLFKSEFRRSEIDGRPNDVCLGEGPAAATDTLRRQGDIIAADPIY